MLKTNKLANTRANTWIQPYKFPHFTFLTDSPSPETWIQPGTAPGYKISVGAEVCLGALFKVRGNLRKKKRLKPTSLMDQLDDL